MSKPEQMTFFRYQSIVMAFNHDTRESNYYTVLPVKQCKQYAQFKGLMDVAVSDLENKHDGKWIFSPYSGEWQYFPLNDTEEVACELALSSLQGEVY